MLGDVEGPRAAAPVAVAAEVPNPGASWAALRLQLPSEAGRKCGCGFGALQEEDVTLTPEARGLCAPQKSASCSFTRMMVPWLFHCPASPSLHAGACAQSTSESRSDRKGSAKAGSAHGTVQAQIPES